MPPFRRRPDPPPAPSCATGGPTPRCWSDPSSAPPAGRGDGPGRGRLPLTMSNGKIVTCTSARRQHRPTGSRPGPTPWGRRTSGRSTPRPDDIFKGAPGAILNGQGINQSAFEQDRPGGDDRVPHHRELRAWHRLHRREPRLGTELDHPVQHHRVQHRRPGWGSGTDDVVTENCLADNDQYGFNAVSAGPVSNITLTEQRHQLQRHQRHLRPVLVRGELRGGQVTSPPS